MNEKELVIIIEQILRDLHKRTKCRSMYGEDWDVSYDVICNGKYTIDIHLENADNFSMYLGKKPYFIFRLMDNETCTFLIEENTNEIFIKKCLEIINK